MPSPRCRIRVNGRTYSTSFLRLAGASPIRVSRNRGRTAPLVLLLSAGAQQVCGDLARSRATPVTLLEDVYKYLDRRGPHRILPGDDELSVDPTNYYVYGTLTAHVVFVVLLLVGSPLADLV
jgi:hypothetical protein